MPCLICTSWGEHVAEHHLKRSPRRKMGHWELLWLWGRLPGAGEGGESGRMVWRLCTAGGQCPSGKFGVSVFWDL